MAKLGSPIVLDGSYGEGGGALLRTALAMSALTQQPLRIENARGATKFPGLSSEDIAIVKALGLCCQAETVGAEVGEHHLSFLPTKRPHGLNEKLDVPEARDGPGHANALVVLGTLLPIMARTGVYSTILARGETYGHNVLSFDYFANVTLGAARRFGLYAYADLSQAGFGRGSRGDVGLEIEPSLITGCNWKERGELIACRAIVATGELPEPIGQRGVAHLARLSHFAGLPIDAENVMVKAKAPGAFVTIWAEFENGFGGATAMGARGVRMEGVVQSAFESFQNWFKTDATVDEHLADQILLVPVLAEGETTFKVSRLTQRFLTMVWVIKQFLPIHITVRGKEGSPGTVTIRR
jgi:RNA 3'-terminal phosphate cyclase (ATP)